MGLNFNGRDYSNQPRDYAYIYGVQEASSTSTPGGDPGFTSQLTFYTNTGGAVNTLPTQKMVITAAGNVGIGTTSPGAKLDVKDGSSAMRFQEYSNGASLFLDGVDGDFIGGDYFNISAYGATELAFGYGAVTKMVMKSTGNVGIGTTSPSSPFTVATDVRAAS